MRIHGNSSRLIVSLLLAVMVPFCCCNFHSWLSVCVPCEGATHQSSIKLAGHHHSDRAVHERDFDQHAEHHAEHATALAVSSESESSPCGPGHDNDHDCTCSKQQTLMMVAKTTVDFPTPVLVAVVSFPTVVDLGVSNSFHIAGRDLWESARPPTTLLYLHCALIV